MFVVVVLQALVIVSQERVNVLLDGWEPHVSKVRSEHSCIRWYTIKTIKPLSPFCVPCLLIIKMICILIFPERISIFLLVHRFVDKYVRRDFLIRV